MNFLILKEIIVQLKRKFRCPKCRKAYGNRDITIAAAAEEQLDVVLGCKRCGVQVLANVSMFDEEDLERAAKDGRQHRSVKVRANSFSKVTENDVLDMKNFLKDFKGSFRNLFTIE